MNVNLAVILGGLQAQIYWLHDAGKYTELALADANIYKNWFIMKNKQKTQGS